MIKRREYIECYWEPYLSCERELVGIFDYVALRSTNYQTSSERFIRSLLSTCELFESLMKSMYAYSPNDKTNFARYKESLLNDNKFDLHTIVRTTRGINQLEFRPFAGFDTSKSLNWWKAHNDVKHDRVENFEQGNFLNALESLAALYYVNLLYVKKIGDYWRSTLDDRNDENCKDVPNDISHLFRVESLVTRYHVFAYESYTMSDEDFMELMP